MLILTRNEQENVIITDKNGSIIMKIVSLHNNRNNQVRLGFDAEPSYKIYREELYNKIIGNNANNEEPDGNHSII